MGCCISSDNQKYGTVLIKSPPTAEEEEEEEEEEAIKQVLSETPLSLKPIPSNPFFYTLEPNPPEPKSPMNEQINTFPDEISTFTAPRNAQLRKRLPRSPSPGRTHSHADPGSFVRERLTGNSPVKRSDSSPRRSGSGQLTVSGSGLGNSGRRSRSPVAKNEAGASRSSMGRRSPSGRSTGFSPGKVRRVRPGSGPGDGCERDSWDLTNPTAPIESLENPLVSLECFIFL